MIGKDQVIAPPGMTLTHATCQKRGCVLLLDNSGPFSANRQRRCLQKKSGVGTQPGLLKPEPGQIHQFFLPLSARRIRNYPYFHSAFHGEPFDMMIPL